MQQMQLNKILYSVLITTAAMFSSLSSAATKEQVCAAYADNAASIQHLRQNGVAMSRVMQAVVLEGQAASALNKVYSQMVIRAYSVARYSTEEYKTRAMEDFRDSEHLYCLKLN